MSLADWRSLNEMTPDDARAAFLRCCGSRRWAEAMTARRPYLSREALFQAAEEIDAQLTRADWLEAFAAHPRIGDLEALRKQFASTASWCSSEQAGVTEADEKVLRDLAQGNREYERRFGYLFIVCASGKSAAEMLAILRARLENQEEEELRVAAREQARITRLRLDKP
jgi:2-oxo-4-hydroxy-4-carboxy-5-ureidoimidazoline decarboxylase